MINRLLGAVRRRASEESGMTLMEPLVVMPLALLVLGAIFMFVNLAFKDSAQATSRHEAAIDQQNGMERIGRDARALIGYGTWGDWAIDLTVCGDYTCAQDQRYWVRWDCNIPDPDQGDEGLFICARSKVDAGQPESALDAAQKVRLIDDVQHPGPIFQPVTGCYGCMINVAIRVKVTGGPGSGILMKDTFMVRQVPNS